MKNLLPFLAVICVSICVADDELPTGSVVRGEVAGIGGFPMVAEKPVTITIPAPADAGDIVLRLKTGANAVGVFVSLKFAGGPPVDLLLRSRDLKLPGDKVWTDAYLEGPRANGRFFIRPNATFYKEERIKQLAPAWEALPAASEHITRVEFRRNGTQTEIWLDGRFVLDQPGAGKLASCELRLAPGAALHSFQFAKHIMSDLLPLPIGDYVRTEARAEVTLAPDAKLPPALALDSGPQPELAVAGLGRLVSPSDDLVSYAWGRSGLDALPEVAMFSVPLEVYGCAHVLCAAEEDPAKIPAFTLRLTRYGNSRGSAMADSIVRVRAAGDARQVGSVMLGTGAARKSVPLWLIRVPIKSGLVPELFTTDKLRNRNYASHRYLDVELLDPIDGVEENDAFPPTLGATGRYYNPRGKQSSVHVLGLTLERSPATLAVETNTPVKMFYAADAPEFKVTVTGVREGGYTLVWDFADLDGKTAASGRQELSLTGEKHEQSVAIPVQQPNGWYTARFRVLDAAGREWLDHRSSFVMLPPDTRHAGFESPYGAWWFHWAHGGEPNIERVGPMLQRAGLRHTILPSKLPESLTAPYGVSAFNIGWFRPKDPKAPFADRLVEHEAYIREQLRLYPSLDKILVWHESGAGGAAFPSEMWGETPAPAAESVEQNWQVRMEYITALAKMVRAKFPQLKLQYGNDGSSLNLIAGLLRHKFPRELIDSFAVEDLGQTIIPEKAIPGGMQSAWYLRETARALGYGDVPITACHEWMGRRDMALGLGGQAEWYIRDVLHARAYGFQTGGVGTVHDAGNGYYHTLWGDGGLCKRWPAMDPKPAYAAVATFTRMIDGTKFERAVPTGTHSLYVVEYRRAHESVYAVWVPRGRRDVNVRFDGAAEAVLTDLYGREQSVRGPELKLTASTAPQYLVSRTRIASVVAGKVWFPEDAPPQSATAVDAMDSLAHWSIQPEKDKRLERVTSEHMPHRTQGPFELREAEDAEQGKCLELELKPEGDIWDVMHEYAVLKLANPVATAGPFEQAGVWVKGNSGWGEVMWELENAKGEKWLSQGVYMDWPGNIALNFDGWNFLRLPLRPEAAWRSQVKITGLVVTMPRKMLYLTEMEKVPELKVRLKELCLF